MDKPICHVRNLRKSALSGYVSEVDAIATGGRYLAPDADGSFDASLAHDLCVTRVNCGSEVSNPGLDEQQTCSQCGMDDLHVVQTIAPPPRRPTYTPLVPPTVPSSPSSFPDYDDAEDSPIVSPWARWAARTLDFFLSLIVPVFVLGIFLTLIGCETENISDVGALILGVPPGMALDALCHHFWGWSLGKWLFAVKVRHHDGTRLGFAEYFKRNFWVLVKGYGLCIPIVNLVMSVIQYNRLREGKPASYDEGKDIRITRARHSTVRTIFGIVAMVVMIVFLAICNAA